MLLYASIESHCIVQLTNTKTADSERQLQLGNEVVNVFASEQPNWLLVIYLAGWLLLQLGSNSTT